MDRRKFIKTSFCMGAVAALNSCMCGCKFASSRPEEKFRYRSISDLPKSIRLEACNACQLGCPKCTYRNTEKEIMNHGGGIGYLKFEDFKKFIDKHSFVESIEISNNGEIFLNPELNDIMKYAYEKGVQLFAYNGVNLNNVSEETLENLVKYKMDRITVSIDGATPDTYKIYRVGGDFDTVINNIKIINKFKEQYNSEYPHLIWQFILFGHNEHEIDLAKERAAELGMDIHFIRNLCPDYSPVHDLEMIKEKTGVDVLAYNFKDMYAYKKEDVAGTVDFAALEDRANPGMALYCSVLGNYPQINFNGDLLGCCVIAEDNFGVNVFDVGLLNALNTDKVLRAKLMLSDFSVEPFDDVPCGKCGIYEDIKAAGTPVHFNYP